MSKRFFYLSTATAAASILLNTLDAGKAPLVRKKAEGFGASAALPIRGDSVPPAERTLLPTAERAIQDPLFGRSGATELTWVGGLRRVFWLFGLLLFFASIFVSHGSFPVLMTAWFRERATAA